MEEEDISIEDFYKDMCPVMKQGWLWKKKQRGFTMGGWVPMLQWQQRWFLFDNQRSQLCYGPDAEHAHKRNIRFDEIDCVCRSREPFAHEGKRASFVAQGLQFEIHLTEHAHHNNDNRVFILQAATRDDVYNWIKLLKEASLLNNPLTKHTPRKSIFVRPTQPPPAPEPTPELPVSPFITPFDMAYPTCQRPPTPEPPGWFCCAPTRFNPLIPSDEVEHGFFAF